MENSAKTTKTEHFELIINTNKYAGNFEREMCAYITGLVGCDSVGDEERMDFLDEPEYGEVCKTFKSIVIEVDDEGCCRPVEIYNMENSTERCSAVKIEFCSMPDQCLIDIMIKRCKEFCLKNDIELLEFKIDKFEFLNKQF